MRYFSEHFGMDVLDRVPIQISVAQLLAVEVQVSEMEETFLNDCRLVAVRSLTEAEQAAQQGQDGN